MKRLTIVLDDADAELLLQLAGSSRKQSEVLSGLIRSTAQNVSRSGAKMPANDAGNLKALALQILRLDAELSTLKVRLLALENGEESTSLLTQGQHKGSA